VSAVSIAANPAFQLKLVLIALAGLNAAIFHRFTYRGVEQWNLQTPPPVTARAAGLISILLWTGVITCGRLIAYV